MGHFESKMAIPGKDIEEYPDRVEELLKDQTLFISGGTGFLGKVLIEKVLRTCDVKRIYLLIRTKKGKDPNERLKDVFSNVLFDKVKAEKGEQVVKRVVALAGDCSSLGLALSAEDRQTLIDEVNFVYHCAATVRFDDPLKKAVLLNVRGTKLMLELAAEMPNLVAYCHVSTAYCHLDERVLYEKPYPPPANPHDVIKTVEWMDEDVVDTITNKLLGNIPNTYAFTKALAEGLVNERLDKMPIFLVRPSVVIPIWKEPVPGWTDNINGPTGLLIGAGKGVIRTMYCNSDRYADYLPVDIAVNALLCTTWDFVENKARKVYNFTSSSEYKITWEQIIQIGREVVNTRIPLNGVVWYPGGSMKSSRLLHNIAVLFFHLLPAVVLDALLFCLGYKPVLLRVQRKILKGFEMFEYYANNQWDFDNRQSLEARSLQNPKEMRNYLLHGDGIDYHDYFTHCVHAARLYILNESDESIPRAKRHMKIMFVVDKICKVIFAFACLYFVYSKILAPIFATT